MWVFDLSGRIRLWEASFHSTCKYYIYNRLRITSLIYNLTIKSVIQPKYLLSALHPPGEIVLHKPFSWHDPQEWRFKYGVVSSATKIKAIEPMGAPSSIISWQNKRFNNRIASPNSDAEGSFRLLCNMCQNFQTHATNPSPFLIFQGCSFCCNKIRLVDPTLYVSNLFYIFNN